MVTYYVVQSWQMGRKGVLIADDAVEAPSEQAAVARARLLGATRAGAIAFARTGEPDLGLWEDAVVLCEHGLVPSDLMELAG